MNVISDGAPDEGESEEWLNVTLEAEDGAPSAVSTVLRSVATTLDGSPEGYRYDLSLKIEERQPTNGEGGEEG